MRKTYDLLLLVLSFALLIAGVTFYSKALFTKNIEGESEISSAEWLVEASSYQKFGTNVHFNGIKPGDSGITNLGATLVTNLDVIPTVAIFHYNISSGLEELEFYLVDNTSNQALLIQKISGTGEIVLDVNIFTRNNDLELRWIYPKESTKSVSGMVRYSVEFSQVGDVNTTYYTDVWAGSLGTYDNIEVTVNKVDQTVSFVLLNAEGSVVLSITDTTYTDSGTYLYLEPNLNYPDGIKITNPEVINP